MPQKISLIYGGKSGEHEVSIKTAFSITQSVDYQKYEVTPVYVSLEGKWFHYNGCLTKQPESIDSFSDINNYKPLDDIFTFFKSMDVVFPVIHGPNGEDGTLQGMLEILNIPYVGSGVVGSSLGMDKDMMKTVFAQHNIPQGPYLSFLRTYILEHTDEVVMSIEQKLGFPVFVKPANLGSSIGISKAKNANELIDALQLATRFDYKVVVETAIVGRELEIGVLGHSNLLTSEVGEISTTKEFYDYEAKYENQDVTSLQIPAEIPAHVKERMSSIAKESFSCLECSGLARVDFFWDEQSDELYVNEINTLPGFTPFSMYPMLFKEVGISYTALIDNLINLAFEKFHIRQANLITDKESIKE